MSILSICNFLDRILNPVMGFFFCVEIVLLFISCRLLSCSHQEIKRINAPARKKRGKVIRTSERVLKQEETGNVELNWNKYLEFCVDHQNRTKLYDAYSLFIQLFPLLGILGTVAGLYIAISQGENIYDGVKFALSSTILGLGIAIIFKFCDILLVSSLLNPIESEMELFEKNYSATSQDAMLVNHSSNN